VIAKRRLLAQMRANAVSSNDAQVVQSIVADPAEPPHRL
jgi:hypothetical protein